MALLPPYGPPIHVSTRTIIASFLLLTFAAASLALPVPDAPSRRCVTNVAQFSAVPFTSFLEGCDFHLSGQITLVDTNRGLVVLQDETAAVALNFPLEGQKLVTGQLVTVDGTNCCPLCSGFPPFPYRPSGREIRHSFETPSNWGEYNLTRMRGFLHPRVTGTYRFWIASDNSSELWLSTDSNPANIRRIATVPHFMWTDPRQWTKDPAQASEPIRLDAGESYYIEALQEQTVSAEHLAVAWQEPEAAPSAVEVIDDRYLTPWPNPAGDVAPATNGILREYWTNYFGGIVDTLGGARAFESALSVEQVCLHLHGQALPPQPAHIAFNQPLANENLYRWVTLTGWVKFKGTDRDTAVLEIFDGREVVQARIPSGCDDLFHQLTRAANPVVRVEGVCEGVSDENGKLMPRLIWTWGAGGVSILGTTNGLFREESRRALDAATNEPTVQGYFAIKGVITFNDRVLGKNYVFVQRGEAVVSMSIDDDDWRSRLPVGLCVDTGGALEPGPNFQTIVPLFAVSLGWQAMPAAIPLPGGYRTKASLDGRWTEIECVVRSVNTNGTLSVMTRDGPAFLWLGGPAPQPPSRYVDAKIRVRGVLLLSLLDEPLLLVPSATFVEVEEAAPEDPFALPHLPVGDLRAKSKSWPLPHRTSVVGTITYRDANSLYVQDSSGGIRVQMTHPSRLSVGDAVEVVGFPTWNGSVPSLTDILMLPDHSAAGVQPRNLDLSEAFPSRQSGTLVDTEATLLARKTNGLNQVLELQEQQRVFTATLPDCLGALPDIPAGSRVRVAGVCEAESATVPPPGERSIPAEFMPSCNILLRQPQDVIALGGPPWWSWRKTVMLVGTLLAVSAVALLWVRLLQRRLELQEAAQLAFSQQVLGKLEDERRRIAVNLHDSLGQTLLVIKNHALLAAQSFPPSDGTRNRLDEISNTTSQAIEEIRRITHGLRPYQLDRLGLTQAIRASLIQAADNTSISFASRVEEIDGLFDKDAEIHVYRIVQEAVTNVVKHSGASELTVVVKKRPAAVSLSFRDNGKGFEPAHLSARSHELGFGLTGIEERTRILGGTLSIDSKPDSGTSLSVEIPIGTPQPSSHHE